MAKPKSKGGRPSSYKPEYCDALVKHMTQGLSLESFAGVIGKHKDTLYEWEKTHPEFSDAKKRGEASSLLWWEKLGIKGMVGGVKGFNSGMWIFNMKNRFKWRDMWDEAPKDTQSDALKSALAIIKAENSAKSAKAKKK